LKKNTANAAHGIVERTSGGGTPHHQQRLFYDNYQEELQETRQFTVLSCCSLFVLPILENSRQKKATRRRRGFPW